VNAEIGRELKASELRIHSVVVITPPGHPEIGMTMWVRSIEPDFKLVEFYSAVKKWSVINLIQPDDTIQDDQGRTVRVFEYLGKI
jgi:hypothetical protein